MKLIKFELTKTNEILTPVSGLACVRALLSKTNLKKKLNSKKIPKMSEPDIKNGDVALSYTGLLCQGKNDFESIEPFRQDKFFKLALGIEKVPSSPTLRQRMDIASSWKNIILEESALLLRKTGAKITPCYKDYIALDIDVSPFDNSKTKK